MQACLKLETTASTSHRNIFGVGIDAHPFGVGFPWKVGDYLNFGSAAPRTVPYFAEYGIEEAVIPDYRGMNAVMGNADSLVRLCARPKLFKTTRALDAFETRRGLSVLSITADCHTVVLIDRLRQRTVVLHCGRDALQPIRKDGARRAGRDSVIDTAMAELMPTNVDDICVLILCGIGPRSYRNRPTHSDFHKAVVAHFVHSCGRGVVRGEQGDEHLDIPSIIRAQLNKWGVGIRHPQRIVWDEVDTFEDKRFNSRRRSPDGTNGVLVDMRHAFA